MVGQAVYKQLGETQKPSSNVEDRTVDRPALGGSPSLVVQQLRYVLACAHENLDKTQELGKIQQLEWSLAREENDTCRNKTTPYTDDPNENGGRRREMLLSSGLFVIGEMDLVKDHHGTNEPMDSVSNVVDFEKWVVRGVVGVGGGIFHGVLRLYEGVEVEHADGCGVADVANDVEIEKVK